MRIIYLDLEMVRQVHRSTIAHSGGGAMGEIDIGKLESVLEHIQNDDYYPSFAAKLTHLFFAACKFHCFVDGNKRIAITLCTQMLLLNGYMSFAGDFLREMENISYHVAAGRIDRELLGDIIQQFINEGELDESMKLRIYQATYRDAT